MRSKPTLNAGSTAKLVKTLIAKGLAEERIAEGKIPAWRTTDGGQRLAVVITDAGLSAVGMAPGGNTARSSRPAGKKGPVAAKRAVVAAVSHDEPRRPRPGTKLAILVELLGRKEGATVAELASATNWKEHSVRGVMSGALVTKFGLSIISGKTEGSGRVYRLRSE